jgi:hypothetical protein
MNLLNNFKKIRIRLRERRRDRKGTPLKIEVKEKEYFRCKGCNNRYDSFHVYCPQCLGILEGNTVESAMLKILSVPKGKEEEIAQMLKTLSGQKPFDFKKALQSLPWKMIQDSEPEILNQWKEVLISVDVKAEIERPPEVKKKKSLLGSAPLFSSRAPLPNFFTPATDVGIRSVASSLKNVSIRLEWVETVLSAYHIVEGLYKRDSYNRILFFDFLLQIDNDLQKGVKEYERIAKPNEEHFLVVIARIQTLLQNMQAEMEEVQHQVKRSLGE